MGWNPEKDIRNAGGPASTIVGSSAGGIFDAPYRMLTGYDPNKVRRKDVPPPEPAPEPMKDADEETRKARERALMRAMRSFGMRSTQKTGSLGVQGQANVKRPTLGA